MKMKLKEARKQFHKILTSEFGEKLDDGEITFVNMLCNLVLYQSTDMKYQKVDIFMADGEFLGTIDLKGSSWKIRGLASKRDISSGHSHYDGAGNRDY